MAASQRITLELTRASDAQDRWRIPLAGWPGFHLVQLTDLFGNPVAASATAEGVVVYKPGEGEYRLFAAIDLDRPAADIKSAKLDFERQKVATEDKWRMRTYMFTVGSAILTAIVTLAVALIAKPSHSGASINVDAVHACRDSVQRLGTLTQLQGQTLQGLTTAVNNHVLTCDPVLEGLISEAAKSK